MTNKINIPMKICTYSNHFVFYILTQKLVQNSQFLKDLKFQNPKSDIPKNCREMRQKMQDIGRKNPIFQLNIKINRVVYIII